MNDNNNDNQLSSPKKRKRRHFSVEDKTVVLNTFKVFSEKFPEASKTEKVELSAKAVGVSAASVYNILKEHRENHEFRPPKVYHTARSVLDNVTDEQKNIIRIVHSFFLRNAAPTVAKILTAVNECDEGFNFKESTLRRLLKEINFRFLRRSRESMLKEKNEIIVWRRKYLRQIKNYRENKKIYYLDETWVNVGHTVQKVWTDTEVRCARDAFIRGLSTGLKNPSGKGKRLIILHIGSATGFVENGLLLFESKKTGDYHEDMNSTVFEAWFKKILPTLEEGAVIVMDNATYHSRRLEKIPTGATRKADIQQWLTEKNIPFEENMVKPELLHLVQTNKPLVNTYVVDSLAEATNRTVLRLPPYHCELNPIELIWAQAKGEVARKNVTFKLSDVKNLFLEALENVTPENWQNACRHVISVENNMWQLDVVMEIQVEPLIINLQDDSDDSEFDDLG